MRIAVSFLTILALGLPATAMAADGPRPSINVSPESPRFDQAVTLSAASSGSGVTFSWDLDGDGVYGDATGPSVSRTFPAGERVVAVRATDAEGKSGTEIRTVVVSENVPPKLDLALAGTATSFVPYPFVLRRSDVDGSFPDPVRIDYNDDGGYEAIWSDADPGPDAVFFSGGGRVLRASVTDDDGATSTATATVPVAGAPLTIPFFMYGQSFDTQPVAGVPLTIEADNHHGPEAADYEYDFDGDGVYETDMGSVRIFQHTFTAGDHTVGLRATDASGHVYISRTFVHVLPTEDRDALRANMQHTGGAAVGVPVDLEVGVFPERRAATVAFDADGDGAFDDGSGSIADGQLSNDVRVSHTYAAPGIYEVRAKITNAHGDSQIGMRTITVADAPPLPPTFDRLELPAVIEHGREVTIATTAAPGAELSYDLDGDGQFDEIPATTATGFKWTFTAPVTIAVKATDAAGRSSLRTASVTPVRYYTAPPVAELTLTGDGRDRPLSVTYSLRNAPADCCRIAWDADGDGAYDDGAGAFPGIAATTGEHTVGLRVEDMRGGATTVRKQFRIEGPAAAPNPTKAFTLRTSVRVPRLGTLMARGLKVTVTCSAACRTTIVARIDKKTAKRLKLRSTEVGKGSGKGTTVVVKLNAKARKALRKARSVKLKLAVTARAADGRVRTTGRTVTVKR